MNPENRSLQMPFAVEAQTPNTSSRMRGNVDYHLSKAPHRLSTTLQNHLFCEGIGASKAQTLSEIANPKPSPKSCTPTAKNPTP